MSAKLIWIEGENRINTWMCCVKDYDLQEIPAHLMTRIAVDSKYWLWINGKEIIFEGGVKRGPYRSGTYYDELDLAKHLVKGKNRIAVLVWYFGDDGFSHISSGQGGLFIDSELIFTDETWKIIKHPAFVEADGKDMPSNFRLAESNIYYDARNELGDWIKPDYCILNWKQADVIEKESWGELVPRMIPLWKDYGKKEYINSCEVRGVTTEIDIVFAMKLPYNAQVTPCLCVDAHAGARISIYADNYDDALYDTKSVMAVYYTKEGKQEYESLGWINGEIIYYSIPAGVTILDLFYRETGYNTEFEGHFVCKDDFLNKLWEKSRRTLYITMRDNFMDCPDRERAQWWGDVNVEMQMMMYCMDDQAKLLYKKGVISMAGYAKEAGHMITVVPSGKDQFELPLQNLAGIYGFMIYYNYTEDLELLKIAYPMSNQYLELFEMQQDGLIQHRKGSWDWPDWGDNSDVSVMENAWYYMALSSARKMAELLGKNEDIVFYDERLASIKDNFVREFFKGQFYYNETNNGEPDDRANALAALSGLAPKEHYPLILDVLNHIENASPYMEFYVLEAMCEMGYIDEAVTRMKRRYRAMVEDEYSTLWEYWNTDGTKNHAWSGGPLVIMSKYYKDSISYLN